MRKTALRQAALVVRFEDLCDAPATKLREVFEHCRLPFDEDFLATAAARIQKPGYDEVGLDVATRQMIADLTTPVAVRLGYRSENPTAV